MLVNPYISAVIIIVSMMTIVYIIALIKNDYSVIDIFWPVGFGLLSYYLLDFGVNININLVKIFVTVWTLRLSSYLLYRNIKHGPDARYRELQIEWGKAHPIHAFFKVFMLQGGFMFLIAMPLITGAYMTGVQESSLWLGSTIIRNGSVIS